MNIVIAAHFENNIKSVCSYPFAPSLALFFLIQSFCRLFVASREQDIEVKCEYQLTAIHFMCAVHMIIIHIDFCNFGC